MTAARCSVDYNDSNSMPKRLLLWAHHDGSLMLSEVNRLRRQIGAHGTAMLDPRCIHSAATAYTAEIVV